MDTKRKMRFKLNSNNNPRFEDGVIKLKLYTNAHQYIFVNMLLIQKIQDFFKTSDKPEEQVDLSYYTDQAKIRALEFMNQGADYLESTVQTEYIHQGIDVDVEVLAPVLIIPESITDLTNKKTLVFNLGYIRVTSELRPYHRDVDYKWINRGEELYDQYDLKINGFQLTMVEELRDYKQVAKAKRKIDIIDQIEVNLKANRCLEPSHPKFPSLELLIKIHEIDIYFSDYVMANLMNIQKSLTPPEPEEKPKQIENKELKEDKFKNTNK